MTMFTVIGGPILVIITLAIQRPLPVLRVTLLFESRKLDGEAALLDVYANDVGRDQLLIIE
jgi:hypothetical protein